MSMSSDINRLLARQALIRAKERADREAALAQRDRELAFIGTMAGITAAACAGLDQWRPVKPRANPIPHPSDEGRKPLRTNWPQPDQRSMSRLGAHIVSR